jgi:hypothetical protein
MLYIGVENTTALADLHVGFWREDIRIIRFIRYIAPEILKYIRYLLPSVQEFRWIYEINLRRPRLVYFYKASWAVCSKLGQLICASLICAASNSQIDQQPL